MVDFAVNPGAIEFRSWKPPIKSLGWTIDVAPIRDALKAHPELWGQNPGRTDDQSSPHYGTTDIWARYAATGESGAHKHVSQWYPCADLIPIRKLVEPLVDVFFGKELGGVLITRIPPSGCVKPHVDTSWHARYYEKFAVSIEASPGQEFCFEDAKLETHPGEVFWFDNSRLHWVTNETPHERITVIACIRR